MMWTSEVRAAVVYSSTSGRPDTKRWSRISQVRQASASRMWTGRGVKGTGLAGSET